MRRIQTGLGHLIIGQRCVSNTMDLTSDNNQISGSRPEEPPCYKLTNSLLEQGYAINEHSGLPIEVYTWPPVVQWHYYDGYFRLIPDVPLSAFEAIARGSALHHAEVQLRPEDTSLFSLQKYLNMSLLRRMGIQQVKEVIWFDSSFKMLSSSESPMDLIWKTGWQSCNSCGVELRVVLNPSTYNLSDSVEG
ncbi:hypothetical protein NEOLI_001251 [Neolecta irregularis DAH-3]|uniref:Uncharacterized protein n=1 Tax=Neolecta irregularis (strain DAH-3) TaxID=1198029 RepID=A0A1U7LLU2_NEOID|nr:hypothetical protein NEOLI_001251 [Neolecta irregularis DAH-3]|eukprot:OLL23512.1 hypothetical protein NEOLI_001251 [Neolecta irregularis DAH-3]